MNSLKKVAIVSAIVSAVALLLTIILTPFAVSGVIDTYNSLIGKAEENIDRFWITTDLDKQINELTIDYPGLYGSIFIEESPDDSIHIRNQDWGFEYLSPDIQYQGNRAAIDFNWKNDLKLTEENIMMAISAEFNPLGPRAVIIQIPSHVSLQLNESYLDNLYHSVEFTYRDFANYEELRQQLDTWYEEHQIEILSNEYLQEVNYEMREIQHVRLSIVAAYQHHISAEEFQISNADEYVALKNTRSDLLKKAYNFRKEHSGLTVDELDAEYLNMVSVLETLCAAEKEYDLLAVKVEEARHQLNFGEMSEHQFSALSDSCFTQQVEIDLTISKLREEFSNYVLYEIPLSAETTAQ